MGISMSYFVLLRSYLHTQLLTHIGNGLTQNKYPDLEFPPRITTHNKDDSQ